MTEIITRAEAKVRGLKQYYTGKPCLRGHVSLRSAGSGECMECRKTHFNSSLYMRNAQLKSRYGITAEEVDARIEASPDCPICDTPLTNPHVDHCHTSGDVRGILCRSCNLLLGYAKDNPAILRKAISYLNKYGKT